VATPVDLKVKGKAKARSPSPEKSSLPSTPSTSSVGDYIMGTDYQTWQSFVKNSGGAQEANPHTSSDPHSPSGAGSSSEESTSTSCSETSMSSTSASSCSNVCCSDKHRGESLLCESKKMDPNCDNHPLPGTVTAVIGKSNNEEKGVMDDEIAYLLNMFERCSRCKMSFLPEAFRRHVKKYF